MGTGATHMHRDRLALAGLRATRQRLALARILFGRGHRHLTAERLHKEALAAGVRVSLATVYNSLHRFMRAGLLKQVPLERAPAYFDTNTSDHHHFYLEATGELCDIPGPEITLGRLPALPKGTAVDRVEVIVRVRPIGRKAR